jgi:proteasome lid subunit RPN8/RPN11
MKKHNIYPMIILLLIIVALGYVMIKYNIIIRKDVYLTTSEVTLSKELKASLDSIYTSSLKTEIPLCLAGVIKEDGVTITGLFQPKIYSSNSSTAFYEYCPTYINERATIGTIHNHPNGVCYLSGTDIETYVGDKTRGQILIGLKCSEGYKFYILSELTTTVEEW